MMANRIRMLLLAIAVLCASGAGPAAGSQTLDIDLPQRWAEQFPPEQGAVRYFAYHNPQGILAAKVYVYESRGIAPATSPEACRDAFEKNLEASFRTYRRRSVWDSTVGGVAAKVFDFAFTTRELPNMTMMGRAVSFIKGDIAFSMVLVTLDAFFDEFSPHFGAMTTSVRFAGATEQPRPGPGLQTGGLPQLTDDSGDLPPIGDDMSVRIDYRGGWCVMRLPERPLDVRDVPGGKSVLLSGDIEATLRGFDGADAKQALETAVREYEDGKRTRGRSVVAGGSGTANVTLYTYPVPGGNRAALAVTYPDAPVLILLTVPAEAYASRQRLLTDLIRNVSFR